MINKFKKASTTRLVNWVVQAVDILNERGANIKLKVS